MRFLSSLFNRRKRNSRPSGDFYQDSIDKAGRDQIKKLVEKGLKVPVFLL